MVKPRNDPLVPLAQIVVDELEETHIQSQEKHSQSGKVAGGAFNEPTLFVDLTKPTFFYRPP